MKEAFVPVIKMKFRGIQIDLVFASLSNNEVTKSVNSLSSNHILLGMDDCSIRSLNGKRVNDMIMNLVQNAEVFRTTLRAVKLWATQRGIYGARLGFLGGISCAILVARICQMYPNFCVSKLLQKFFAIFSNWMWSDWPVYIEEVRWESGSLEDLNKFQRIDDDLAPPMRILTPAFPCINAAHNVTQATLATIETQLRCGYQTIKEIVTGRKSWSDLFRRIDFFVEYVNFLEINVLGRNVPKPDFIKYKNLIESKLRRLTEKIERQPAGTSMVVDVVQIHVLPSSFTRHEPEYEYCVSYYFGMKLKRECSEEKIIDLREPIKDFLKHDLMIEADKGKTDLTVTINHLERSQLPDTLSNKSENLQWGGTTQRFLLKEFENTLGAVSYTHLTLPTIYSV
eukprot:TRINITY_DN8032_c0_g1_i2.p1 TRINITY_DN8032_c0_g1~~TRINITY_DN8032_c0_g1_i2.p1  ORF type:complete len:397 (-),score=83.61 TRINITY_DN8032_c0_g1_i2:34-1224(-)